ncbi:CB1 cannabinoid receptor-interacting protein 1-like [Argopecten irradians]|uniref:CB1 cannabinoid receptor-interacting protein 1-like n=1 Tax=Argopecten irradians TaxID=31199 RepID=UPI0037243ECE
MAKNYKISMSLRKQDNDEPVYHKQDGERFSKSQTVKMNINTDYWIKLTIKPSMILRGLVVHGVRTDFVPDTPTKTLDEDAMYYKAKFSTVNFDTHNRGKRKDLTFLFEFDHGVTMKTNIQIKLYKTGETEHSSWGQPLNMIDFDCKVADGQTYVDIVKEKYL